VGLFSRRENSLSKKFPYIVEALAGLPAGTVVDGELIAFVDRGRPEFNLLQNFRSVASRIHYFIFDLLCCSSAIATCSILVFIRHRSTLIAIPAKLLVDCPQHS
jgi:ATP-dependent DNA ligase